MILPNSVRFWLKIFVFIPCFGCTTFVLHRFVVDRTFRRTLSHHVIIVILVLNLLIQLTDGLWILYFYQVGKALSLTPVFCGIWKLIDFYAFTVMLILVGWALVERHILIFHDRWLSTRKRRILIHYLPLVLCVVYPLIFYMIAFYLLPCETTLDYSALLCNFTYCFHRTRIAFIWHSVVHNLLPSSIIVIFSAGLLVRVLRQKHRLRRTSALLYVAYAFDLPLYAGADYYSASLYFSNYVLMFISIAFAASLSEFRAKIRIIIRCWSSSCNISYCLIDSFFFVLLCNKIFKA